MEQKIAPPKKTFEVHHSFVPPELFASRRDHLINNIALDIKKVMNVESFLSDIDLSDPSKIEVVLSGFVPVTKVCMSNIHKAFFVYLLTLTVLCGTEIIDGQVDSFRVSCRRKLDHNKQYPGDRQSIWL